MMILNPRTNRRKLCKYTFPVGFFILKHGHRIQEGRGNWYFKYYHIFYDIYWVAFCFDVKLVFDMSFILTLWSDSVAWGITVWQVKKGYYKSHAVSLVLGRSYTSPLCSLPAGYGQWGESKHCIHTLTCARIISAFSFFTLSLSVTHTWFPWARRVILVAVPKFSRDMRRTVLSLFTFPTVAATGVCRGALIRRPGPIGKDHWAN